MQHGNIRYIRARYATDVANYFHSLLQKDTSMKNKSNVVIFMTGHWDLEFQSLAHFFKTSGNLIKMLHAFTNKTCNWSSAHTIWISAVPFPERNCKHRNNAVIQAANAYLRENIRGLGITEIDSFSIIEPRNNETIRGDHYFGPLKDTTYFVGSVGYIFTNEVIKAVCDL